MPAAWTSALDRFARSVHRYHDRVEVIADRQLRQELQQIGGQLTDSLLRVRTVARSRSLRREEAPTPVRGLLRAGTLCAHATECAVAAAAAGRSRDSDAVRRHVDDVRTVVAALCTELETAHSTYPAHSDPVSPEPRRARG